MIPRNNIIEVVIKGRSILHNELFLQIFGVKNSADIIAEIGIVMINNSILPPQSVNQPSLLLTPHEYEYIVNEGITRLKRKNNTAIIIAAIHKSLTPRYE